MKEKLIKDLKVGDTVYHVSRGDGIITETKVSKIFYDEEVGGIKDRYLIHYKYDGKVHIASAEGKETFFNGLFDAIYLTEDSAIKFAEETKKRNVPKPSCFFPKKVKMDKFTKKLKEMVLEAAEYHPSDLEEDGDEWAKDFVSLYDEELRKLA